jgi:hypothetical protein
MLIVGHDKTKNFTKKLLEKSRPVNLNELRYLTRIYIFQCCDIQTHQAYADQKGGLLQVIVGKVKFMLNVFHRFRKIVLKFQRKKER